MRPFEGSICVLALCVIAGCSATRPCLLPHESNPAALSDGALVVLCSHETGDPGRPVTLRDRAIADVVFERLSDGRLLQHRKIVDEWMTREQRRHLDGTAAFTRNFPVDHAGAMGAHEVFHPLPATESISAGWLYELVEGKGTGDEWPNDGESLALRMASAFPDEVAQALAAGARQQGDENVKLATWCVRCLVRMQRWDPAILRGVEDQFPWYYLKVAFGDADLTGEQWLGCRAALRGDADYREIEPASAGWRDRVLGRFCALTGDASGLPQRLDYLLQFTSDSAWQALGDGGNLQLIIELIEGSLAAGQNELLPIHVVGEASPEQTAWLRRVAPRSYAAAAALSEIGDVSMREFLFWGVDAGVDAAHYAMDMYQAEVAWRSGCMIRLLERALEHGSGWPFWARFWIAEEMRSYLDLETPEFEQELRRVLSSPTGVDVARSPFTGGWGLVPRLEAGR